MVCSRAGLMAVTCALVASLLSFSSLFLPSWSELAVIKSTDRNESANLNVLFGVWGTCIMRENRPFSDIFRHFFHNTPPSKDSNATIAILTCVSYFQTNIVAIHCEEVLDGTCVRSERHTLSSVCAADEPSEMLQLAWDEDQARGTIGSSDTERQQIRHWLHIFLPDLCGVPGHAIVMVSALAMFSAIIAILLLVVGMLCGTYQSRIVHAGAFTALVSAGLHATLIGLWTFETHVLHHEGNGVGSAFYLALASTIWNIVAHVCAMRHLQLERNILVELGLLEEDDESIDDIFKTKKMADEWDRLDVELMHRAEKQDDSRHVEVVVQSTKLKQLMGSLQ